MKFKTTESPNKIGVESQNVVIKFCFAKQTKPDLYENMSYWSECRDFLGDVIYSIYKKEPIQIYGFEYNPNTNPIDTEHTTLGMRFPDTKTLNTFLHNLSNYNLDVKEILYLQKSPQTLVIKLDPSWQKTTLSISYLTFILKCLAYENADNLPLFENIVTNYPNHKESRYIKSYGMNLTEDIERLAKYIEEINTHQPNPHGYITEDYPNIYFVHNYTGFYSVCRWKNPELFASKYLT